MEWHIRFLLNLSCGYYKQHTPSEYILFNEVLDTIETLRNPVVIDKLKQKQYMVIEFRSKRNFYYTDYFMADDYKNPVLCDICGEHRPLYESEGLMLCNDCLLWTDR